MKNKLRKTIINRNQDGLVAIFTVMIIMGILTLLVVGFSNITRLAQRRTLDDSLKTQAFYAAEAGVNSVLAKLSSGPVTSTSCNSLNMPSGINYDIDSTRNIGITCLLVDGQPTNLEFSNVPEAGQGEPIVTELTSANSSNIDEIFFEWDSINSSDPVSIGSTISTGLGTSPALLPEASWGQNVGMVRVDLVPTATAPNNRQDLVDNSYSFFLYPDPGATTNSLSVFAGANSQGGTMFSDCSASGDYRCTGTILIGGPQNSYFMRIYSYYNPVKLRLTAYSGGSVVELRNGQVVVDATGKAGDTYRRIQVRKPATSQSQGFHDVFAVFSGNSICKRFIGISGNTQIERPAAAGSDPSCGF